MTTSAVEPVAIIGIGCRFPGADSPEAFWRLLCAGADQITEVPPDRWDRDAFYDPNPQVRGKMVSRYGAFLERLDLFDAPFFGISPREAVHLDPRQRLALETAWEALEDAGIAPDDLAGSDTGVFMATLRDDYDRFLFEDLNRLEVYSSIGNAHSVLANRISYVFDLLGPSVALDTACSGSLVTVHLACQSLRSGESSLALAGGVNVILRPDTTVVLSKAGVIAPDGRCKTFDANADGIARGEGAGVVVLKLLSQALADGDPIHAVIRGSAVNSDGRSAGLMAPRQEAQEALLRRAYRQAGVAPACIQYVEAHGTGTRLGDPVEVHALGSVLTEGRAPGQRCMIGSVKTNIGHTEAAAGVAGLIKVTLALKHRLIPPTLHFSEPNPLIPFDRLPIAVQTALGPWPDESAPLIAGVSGFGIGGTNAHVVLEEPPRTPAPQRPADQAALFPLSARTPAALRDLARAYQQRLEQPAPPALADLCRTAGAGRNHFAQRRAWAVRSHEELATRLRAFLAEDAAPAATDRQRRLVFLFADQEAYRPELGRLLYAAEPVFRTALERCDRALLAQADWSFLAQLQGGATAPADPELLQPAVFAYQVALAALWASWGVVPDAVLGHGLGEVAAAHVAGALSLEDALRVVIAGSRAQRAAAQDRDTAIVGLPLEKVQFVLMAYEDLLTITGSRTPSTSLISGDPATLTRVLASLERQGISCTRVDSSAGASADAAPPVDLAQALSGIAARPAGARIYSGVTGAPVAGEALDAAYWADHARAPDMFAAAVARLAHDDFQTLVELSPAPVLAEAVRETYAHAGRPCTVLPATAGPDERLTLLGALGSLYERGWAVGWRALAAPGARVVPLPAYPWQRERYWFDQVPDEA